MEARRAVSPATGRRYPLAMVCEVYRIARSSVDASLGRGEGIGPCRKRGPRTEWTDEELVQEVRAVLGESRFLGEGHRKVTARLRFRGIRVGKNRILRLMRRHGLLTPVRRRHAHGDRAHQGTIRTQRPDERWGTDATRFYTEEDGWCSFFGAIDHCCEDLVGWHVAKTGDRWAALEPVRQDVLSHLQGYAPKIRLGLGLRHDWALQYTAHQFAAELRWLGIRSTPAYGGEPECSGIMERGIRTLKEECLHLHDFATLEEARQVMGEFIERYNRDWLLERHGYRTPAEVRRALTRQAA